MLLEPRHLDYGRVALLEDFMLRLQRRQTFEKPRAARQLRAIQANVDVMLVLGAFEILIQFLLRRGLRALSLDEDLAISPVGMLAISRAP